MFLWNALLATGFSVCHCKYCTVVNISLKQRSNRVQVQSSFSRTIIVQTPFLWILL